MPVTGKLCVRLARANNSLWRLEVWRGMAWAITSFWHQGAWLITDTQWQASCSTDWLTDCYFELSICAKFFSSHSLRGPEHPIPQNDDSCPAVFSPSITSMSERRAGARVCWSTYCHRTKEGLSDVWIFQFFFATPHVRFDIYHETGRRIDYL